MPLSDTLNFFTYEELSEYTYEEINGAQYFSVKTFVTPSRRKITNRPSDSVCKVKFEVTSNIDAWECRATLADQPHGVGVGLLIKSGGHLPNDSVEEFNILHRQLTLGDNDYRITVYVKKNEIWYGGAQ